MPSRNYSLKRPIMWIPVAVVALVSIALLHPNGRVRVQLLKAKMSGALPVVPWTEVLADLPPQSWRQDPPVPHPFDLVWGRVTFERIDPGDACPVLWATPLGAIWGRMEDENLLEWLVREQLLTQVYDNEHVHVRSGDTILDLGAHLGTFTDYALHHGAGKVIAFEPEPTNVECLRKTFAEEIQAGKVIIVEAAVSDHSGELHFAQDSGHHGSARGKLAEDGGLIVRATTLDESVASLGLESVDFIKMDIEGAERLALAGARETLERFEPRMAICVYHLPDDPTVIPPLVMALHPAYGHAMSPTQAYFFPKSGS